MNPFKVKPLEIERTVPLALEPCRELCDTMIAGISNLLDYVHIQDELSPWTVEGDAHVTTLAAGKALKARLELVPVEDGTRISLRMTGALLIPWRKEILRGIMDKLEEMGGGDA